jgi:hypothetical protein
MKAPSRINKFVENQGFSFVKGACYMKNIDGLNIIAYLDYQKISGYEEINNKYVSIDMNIAYPYGNGLGFVMNPPPLESLSKDGNLRYSCDKYDHLIWFDIGNIDEILSALEGVMASRFADLLNSELMVSVIDFCMELGSPPCGFQYLEDMPLPKGKSPACFTSKVAYFNIAGKYDEAIETLGSFAACFKRIPDDPVYKKLLLDAKNKCVL